MSDSRKYVIEVLQAAFPDARICFLRFALRALERIVSGTIPQSTRVGAPQPRARQGAPKDW